MAPIPGKLLAHHHPESYRVIIPVSEYLSESIYRLGPVPLPKRRKKVTDISLHKKGGCLKLESIKEAKRSVTDLSSGESLLYKCGCAQEGKGK